MGEVGVIFRGGREGEGYSIHPAVYRIEGVVGNERRIEVLRTFLDAIIRPDLIHIENPPRIGVHVVRGDIGKEWNKYVDVEKVRGHLRRMIEEDEALKKAVNIYKNTDSINPKIFMVKREPKTMTAAAVAYILYSLAVAAISAAEEHPGLLDYMKAFHRRKIEWLRKFLIKEGGEVGGI